MYSVVECLHVKIERNVAKFMENYCNESCNVAMWDCRGIVREVLHDRNKWIQPILPSNVEIVYLLCSNKQMLTGYSGMKQTSILQNRKC